MCLLRAAKNRAILKGIAFNLEVSDIVIPEYCPILHIRLVPHHGHRGGKDASPSLDRIDPEKGYMKDNIQVISNKANMMKSSATVSELLCFAEWVYNTYHD